MAMNSCRRLKRVLDVAVSLLGLLLFAPVILGAALVYLPEHWAPAAVPATEDGPVSGRC
jgi:lipopolysaccharide/colanic/teichoic acid biosynthesis glycosyltransferase